MDKRFAGKGKLILVMLLSVLLIAVNTGCSVSDLADAVKGNSGSVEEVTVKNVSRLLDAIKPNTDIVLKEGEYNFSTELKQLYGSDGNEFNKSHDYVKIEACEDGYQIIIENVNNLTIESKKDAEVNFSNISSSAKIFSFVDCKNITLMNFNVSHTRNKDNMNGEVMAFKNCEKVELSGVKLSGAKGYGITLNNVSEFKINYSEITKCKSGIIDAKKSTDISILKCDFYENEGRLINAYGSEVEFKSCSFDNNVIVPEFVSKSADNNIVFKDCTFGSEEAAALDSGEVNGDEGYSFDDSCVFAEVANGGIGGVGSYQEYVVSDVQSFFETLGPNRTIRLEEGVYDIGGFLDSLRDAESWATKLDYVSVYSYGNYYSVSITDCDNLCIVGDGSYNEHLVTILSSSSRRCANISIETCDNIRIQNIEFLDDNTYNAYDSFIEFYECKSGEISAVKFHDYNGYGMEIAYCLGDWYIYDTEFYSNINGPMELTRAEGNWYFDGCRFVDNGSGIDVENGWYTKFLSFKYCYFTYKEWVSVNIDNSKLLVSNCTHEEVPYEYMLVEYEDLGIAYVEEDILTDTWYGYLYLEDREIYSMPGNDKNGKYRMMEITFLDDGTGFICLNDKNNILNFEWTTHDPSDWINEILIWVDADGEQVTATASVFANDEDIARVQLYYDGIYYMCW